MGAGHPTCFTLSRLPLGGWIGHILAPNQDMNVSSRVGFLFRSPGKNLANNVTHLSRSLKRGWIDESYLSSSLLPSPSPVSHSSHPLASSPSISPTPPLPIKFNLTASVMAFNYNWIFDPMVSTTSFHNQNQVRMIQNPTTSTLPASLTHFPHRSRTFPSTSKSQT